MKRTVKRKAHKRKTKKGHTSVKAHKVRVKKKRKVRPNWGLPKTYVKWMDPDDYLFAAGDTDTPDMYLDEETGKYEDITLLAQRIKEGKRMAAPFTYEGTLHQEGRHRAIASKLAGLKRIPVATESPYTHRTEPILDKFLKRSDQTNRYDREKWTKRFSQGRPTVYMDPKNLNIYNKILDEDSDIGEKMRVKRMRKFDLISKAPVYKDAEGKVFLEPAPGRTKTHHIGSRTRPEELKPLPGFDSPGTFIKKRDIGDD